MCNKRSAGIIPFKFNENGQMLFFLGHPGGMHWENRNFWMFLKGSVENGETWTEAAIREFKEETGMELNDITPDKLIPLGTVQQNPSKLVIAYGIYYPDLDPIKCQSNVADDGITLEIDSFKWMTFDELKNVTHKSHLGFYEQLINRFIFRLQ